MSPDDAGTCEDLLASLLAAGDEALADGRLPDTACPPGTPDEFRPEVEGVLDYVRRVRRLLRSPGPGAPPGPWTTLGRFELGPELGRGGCGIVFRARDPLLGRQVAIKVPRAEVLAEPAWRDRFRREARAAAALDHPNLVPVYEAGAVGPVCFLVSAYCPGATLAAWLRQQRGPVPVRTAAALVAAVADGVQHAHGRGVLHRDLKPGNVLLEPLPPGPAPPADGLAFTPRVTDFGLAKLVQEGEATDQTRSGALLGTVAYMAPEQAAGRAQQVGPAADVYGLGAILYEQLTGRPPFRGETDLDTLRQVRDDEPVPPRRLRPALPRDLETVCLKCLHKEPHRRYATAGALAEDLRRFLAGEPVRARPVGGAARLARWCRRRPALAATAGVATLALAAVVGLSVFVAVRESHAAGRLREEQGHTRAALTQARRLAADLALDRGLTLCERGDTDAGLLWLAHALELVPPEAADLDHAARVNLAAWYGRLDRRPRLVVRHGGAVRGVAVSPDGRTLFTGSQDGTVRRWDAATGDPAGDPLPHPSGVLVSALSPDGTRLATGCQGGTVHLWEAATGRPCGAFGPFACAALAIGFSPDGRTLAAGSEDGTVRLWDVASGQARGTRSAHAGIVFALAFSPDGKTLLTGGNDRTARLWDVASGRPAGGPLPHDGPVVSVAFSPDGTTVATGGRDQTARLWDTATGRPRGEPMAHQGRVTAVVFGADRHTLVTGSHDGLVRFWEAATGKPLGKPLRQRGVVTSLALDSRGDTLLVGCADNTAWLWDLTPGTPPPQVWRHPGLVEKVAFRPDGGAALTGGDEGGWLRETATGRALYRLATSPALVHDLAFSPDGQTVLLGDATGVARLWDAACGRELHRLEGGHRDVTTVAFSPDGRIALTAGREGTARLWDVATGAPRGAPLPHKGEIPCWAVVFSPDGRLVLTGSLDKTARLWDAVTGEPIGQPLAHPNGVQAVAFHPNRQVVLTACDDGVARLWDVATGQLQAELVGHQAPLRAVAFNADGSRILTGAFDSTARLWDTATGKSIGRPLVHQGRVRWVGFSPDGRFALTAGFDSTARLWDAATGRPVGPPVLHGFWVVNGAFSPDGRTFLTASSDGTAHLCPVPGPVPGDAERVRLWAQAVTGLELDETEGVRVLDAATWQERCRRLTALGGPAAP